MTDDPNLARRIAEAHAIADTSTDRTDHVYLRALEGVESAEKYTAARAKHDREHGVADTSDLPPASARLCDICGVRPAELELGDDGVCAVCLAADDMSGL
jgi:hypothetical protein